MPFLGYKSGMMFWLVLSLLQKNRCVHTKSIPLLFLFVTV